jgi:hypothetical protein
MRIWPWYSTPFSWSNLVKLGQTWSSFGFLHLFIGYFLPWMEELHTLCFETTPQGIQGLPWNSKDSWLYIYTYIIYIYIYINNHFFFVRPEPRLSEVWIWPGTQDRERDRPWLLLGMPK